MAPERTNFTMLAPIPNSASSGCAPKTSMSAISTKIRGQPMPVKEAGHRGCDAGGRERRFSELRFASRDLTSRRKPGILASR